MTIADLRVRGDALPAVAGGQRGHQLRRHHPPALPPPRFPLRLLPRMLLDYAHLRVRRPLNHLYLYKNDLL
jgi:hypothetical protein